MKLQKFKTTNSVLIFCGSLIDGFCQYYKNLECFLTSTRLNKEVTTQDKTKIFLYKLQICSVFHNRLIAEIILKKLLQIVYQPPCCCPSLHGEPICGQKNSTQMKVISALHIIRITSLLFYLQLLNELQVLIFCLSIFITRHRKYS